MVWFPAGCARLWPFEHQILVHQHIMSHSIVLNILPSRTTTPPSSFTTQLISPHALMPIFSTLPVLSKRLWQLCNPIFLQKILASKGSPFFHTSHLYFSLTRFHAPYFWEHHEEFNSPLDWWIQGPRWRKWQLSPHAQSLGSSWCCNCSCRINHSLCIQSSTPKCLWQ